LGAQVLINEKWYKARFLFVPAPTCLETAAAASRTAADNERDDALTTQKFIDAAPRGE